MMSTAELVKTLRMAMLTSLPEQPSQFDEVPAKFIYLPQSHMRALSPDTMVVQGIRGAGKSFWWHTLLKVEILDDLAARQTSLLKLTASHGFGLTSSDNWPEKDELAHLLKAGFSARLIWKSVVLRQLLTELVPEGTWLDTVAWVSEHPSEVAKGLREKNECLRKDSKIHVVLFDALDRTADTWNDRQILLRGLLELALEMRAHPAIRTKIFVRPDMLKDPGVQDFPDASKVIGTRVSLDWSSTDLYGLVFHYLANADDEHAAEVFRHETGYKWARSQVGTNWDVPHELRSSTQAQRHVFTTLVGPYMGKEPRKGRTYEWVYNHLGDATRAVSPRSMLAAIRAAADQPALSGHNHALHWKGLHEGVTRASEYRALEIQEDLPWAHLAMTQLGNMVVPCEYKKMVEAWNIGGLHEKLKVPKLRAPQPSTPEALFEALRDVGILMPVSESRVNIPDVYRVGFGMRRRGGFVPGESR